MVADGRLDGYGIVGAQRTRWYVYADALDERPTRTRARMPATRQERLELESTLADMRSREERRRKADLHRHKAMALMLQANKLVSEAMDHALQADALTAEAEAELGQLMTSQLLPDTVAGLGSPV